MLSKVPQHWLVFEVVDTGCGIAPEGLQSLFKEYVQVCLHDLLPWLQSLPCCSPCCRLPAVGLRLGVAHVGAMHARQMSR